MTKIRYNSGMKNRFLPGLTRPLQKGILILLLFCVLAGINNEFAHIAAFSGSYSHYLMALGSTLLLLVYIIPMSLFLAYLLRTWQIERPILWIGLVCGLFVPGWMAAYGNDWLLQGWKVIIPAKTFIADWGDALTAPIVEEGLKAATTLLLIAFFPQKTRRQAFFLALLVGFGFEIMEDISYITSASYESLDAGIPQALDRVYMSMTSHWAYSSLFVLGIYQLVYSRGRKQIRTWIWLLSPIIIHFIWDSPLNSNLFTYAFYGLILALIWLDAFFYLQQENQATLLI